MRLEGKTAIVTGAAGGIGYASARALAREGARLVLADLDGARLEQAAGALAADGHAVVAERVDVTSSTDVKRMIERCLEEYGRLDVMFNNAGIFEDDDGSVVDTSEAVWDRVLAVNLKGVFLGCKYAIPAMLEGGGGSIINTASFVALMGAAVSQSAYTASKGGVLALTREIAVEFARKGIRANALCPGPINTPLLAELLRDEAARQRRFVHIPMGRLGEAREIAEAVVFLASDESSYVTGAEFVVDGGITAAYVTPE
ncbi:MAG: SDR family oxidoreductase [Deltaproteobacteria bacterium]|nr:MAG: SDR family oxidoreductase [Deltaproteobacteria bacterium]